MRSSLQRSWEQGAACLQQSPRARHGVSILQTRPDVSVSRRCIARRRASAATLLASGHIPPLPLPVVDLRRSSQITRLVRHRAADDDAAKQELKRRTADADEAYGSAAEEAVTTRRMTAEVLAEWRE